MACGDMGRFANAGNVLSQHLRFLLKEEEAKAIVNKMKDRVSATWYDTVGANGVNEVDAETIRDTFVYEGF
jgi:serine/threonine-protein kinase HipA